MQNECKVVAVGPFRSEEDVRADAGGPCENAHAVSTVIGPQMTLLFDLYSGGEILEEVMRSHEGEIYPSLMRVSTGPIGSPVADDIVNIYRHNQRIMGR